VPDTADVVVIGAGVIGAATTLELARAGRSVVCVDAGGAVGAGSTSASSAIIRFHYSTWDSVLTAWESAWLWWSWRDHLGVDDPAGMVQFVRTGALMLDAPGSNRTTVIPLMRRAGVEVDELASAEVRARFPAIDTGDFGAPKRVDDPAFFDDPIGELSAYYTPEAGFIDDPMLAAHNLMHAAQTHGAQLRLHARVVDVRSSNNDIVGVTLDSGVEVDAPVVVNVAGPASGRINALAGVAAEMRIRHRPLRNEVHVAPHPAKFALDGSGPLVSDMGVGTYFRPHLGGTMLVGGTEPECDELEWVDNPDEFDDLPSVEGFERSMLRVARRLPDFEIPNRPVGLAALYDASDDWVPIYDGSSRRGYFMACGTSGNQFKNAPMAGRFMAELIAAAENGVDHDRDPVHVVGPHTGMPIDLGAFSRLRNPAPTSGTVMG
jgi:glycine/D-amino acid oxidase-like deaminating enzyme